MTILGLGHYSGTGKDRFSLELVNALKQHDLRGRRVAFADELKELCFDLFHWAGCKNREHYEIQREDRDKLLLPLNLTPVDLWVKVGNTLREISPDVWIEALQSRSQVGPYCEVLIIPDVRYLNEVEWIKAQGGKLIHVVRPGVGPRDTVSDRALAGQDHLWDYVIGGSGSIEELLLWSQKIALAISKKEWPEQEKGEREMNLQSARTGVAV